MAKKRKLHSQKHGSNNVDSFMESNHEGTMEVRNEEVITNTIIEPVDEYEQEQVQTESQNFTPLDSQNIGEFLRSAREAKGLTLQHIAHVTKISLKNLKYLEESALESLPDKIYVFGYVKNYTKVLAINNAEALVLLESEYERLSPPEYSAPEPEIPRGTVSTVSSLSDSDKQNYIIMGLIALVVIIISSVLFFSSNSETEETSAKNKVVEALPVTPQEEIQKKEPVTPMSLSSQTPLQKEIENIPEKNEAEVLKDETKITEKIEAKPATAEVKKVETKPAVAEIKKVEEKKVEEKKEEVKKVEEKKVDSEKLADRKFYKISIPLYETLEPETNESYSDLVPDDINEQHSSDLQNIFVYATGGSCWVTYQTENSKIKQRYLKSGSYTFVRGKEIRMAIGNTGSARVFLNKEPIKLLTTTGVKNLVIPQENSDKYRMPLFVYNKDKNSFLTSAQYIERLEQQTTETETTQE